MQKEIILQKNKITKEDVKKSDKEVKKYESSGTRWNTK